MLTPCLGREQTQARLATALAASRWVSIVGPPGSGKTLLARHAAARGHSTWVNARGMLRADEVLSACLDALDVPPTPGDSPEGALCRAMDGLDSLLVVDGLDLDPGVLGPTFQQVMSSTSEARLAVTSVTMAGQPAERVVRVAPFMVPRDHEPLSGPAVDLFLHRVEAAGGHPVDLEAHADDVRRLLHATGGLPLLIEQIAVQIALVGVTNVVPTASLSEAVHGSYELLDDDQQLCFRRLAQMTSPVSIDVVAEITGVDRDRASLLAGGLVRRSLLELMPDGRFDMLTPIRRHGQFLTASTDDRERANRALLSWADRMAPADHNTGAADAGWLVDLPVMRAAIAAACAAPETRDLGYALANRIFSSLYTSMRAREAVEILEATLVSGDGPAEIGASVARRAGIAASEVRGTYEGLWLLDRADEHALSAPDPDDQLARNASIRAEMHLDAGALVKAEAEARRALDLGETTVITRQAARTLADVQVSRGAFRDATVTLTDLLAARDHKDERWISLSARTLLARIALEQGRPTEATSAARAVVADARAIAEDRVALIAETLLRHLDPDFTPVEVDRESLPWAVRIPVLAQDAREMLRAGDQQRAAGLAADVVVLADSTGLGRDAVEGRLLLARALLASGDQDQAITTFLAALDRAAEMPMPLRAADALDGLAWIGQQRELRDARTLAAAAVALRAPRQAASWGYAADQPLGVGRSVPTGWIVDNDFTPAGVEAVVGLFSGATGPATGSVLDLLSNAERQVAERVALGLTSRQIAADLFISPRTVDAHLTHIYRKLDITTRAKLAALVVDPG
ncbi:transcriptional regulator [Nocardioides sp. CF8]|uniref:helix-turn-helix domain-containing protein n=1 Tax=Nocardioides sp. CF8 TaxID=110319 RepID=UPI0003301100|nr:helix-turn-helix transcriptional regulator [Nocardioides sp. CF8]EON24532.1 transcriptional regulator [Nocardioides sp. CF8]